MNGLMIRVNLCRRDEVAYKARFLFSVQVDRGLPVACRLQAGRFINLLYFSVTGKNNLK